MKKLFYALILIGLAGCGQQETIIPDHLKIIGFTRFYGMSEDVSSVTYQLGNGGERKVLFQKDGLIDQIVTEEFDEAQRQKVVNVDKYIYKYKDDVLTETIQRNNSSISERKTYYMRGLPIMRESELGTEKWEYDSADRITSYYKNDTLFQQTTYMLDSAFKDKWTEDCIYDEYEDEYVYLKTYYDNENKVIYKDCFTGVERSFEYREVYQYDKDGSWRVGQTFDIDIEPYRFRKYNKYGDFVGDFYTTVQYTYDSNGNWIKKIEDDPHSDIHEETIRIITYWED